MFRYAQINEEGYVVSISLLSAEVDAPNMIRLAEDQDVAGKMYVNGEWIDDDRPDPEPEEDPEDIYEETLGDILINQAMIINLLKKKEV